MIGTDLAQPRELLVAAGAGDHFASVQLGEHHATCAHPSRRAQDEHRVAGLDLSVGEEHAMCRAIRDGQGSRAREAHAVRNADQLLGGDEAILGEAAVDELADEALAGIDRMQQHPVADGIPFDPGSDGRDRSRAVAAHHHRQRQLDARHAVQGEQVVAIDGGAADADQHLARAGPRLGEPDSEFGLLQVFPDSDGATHQATM